MKGCYLPNSLTLLRMALVVPVVMALLAGRDRIACYLFLFAGVTDAIDGFLARRFNWSSRFGSMMDPLADKLLMVSTLITLAYLSSIPTWLVVAVLIRDAIIIYGGIAYYFTIGSYDFDPSYLSKLNTFLQISLIVLVIFSRGFGMIPAGFLVNLGYIVFITNILSLVHYVWIWSSRAMQGEAR